LGERDNLLGIGIREVAKGFSKDRVDDRWEAEDEERRKRCSGDGSMVIT
jgi:hypothetical protein